MTSVDWQVSAATTSDASELARVAAACFPLACPPTTAPADIAAFISANLSEDHFGHYIADPACNVLVARSAERIVGYAIGIRHPDGQPAELSTIELSKLYVLPEFHGGPAAELMQRCIDWATRCGAPALWLGVNRHNERAQRFYRRHGFEVTGTRSFQVGEALESDFVMERRLPDSRPQD